MTQLTCLRPAVWKENWLLERQLHFRLQIIKEEHRMTTRSLERYIRDLRQFILCLQHRTPDISSFRHPGTNLIKAINALQRPVEYNTYIKKKVYPNCQLNKKHPEIEDDCKERNSGDFPRQLLIANFRKETLEENQDLVVTSKLECDGSKHPKYGAAVSSVQDQIWRTEVLSRFDTIFDLNAHEPKITHVSAETPDSYHTNRDVTEAAKVIESLSSPRPWGYKSCTSATSASTRLVTARRFSWSAPSRAKQTSIEAKTTTDLTNPQLAPSRAKPTSIEAKTTTDLTNPQLAPSRAKPTSIEAKTTTDLTNPQLAPPRAKQTSIEAKTTTDLTNLQLAPPRAKQTSIEAKTTTDLTNLQLAPPRAKQTSIEAKTTTDLTNPRLAPSRAEQTSIEAKTTTDLTNPQLAASRAKQTSIEAKTTTDLTSPQLADKLFATETLRVSQQIPTTVESKMKMSCKPTGQQLKNKLKRPNTAPPKCPQPERAAYVSRQQIAGFLAQVHSRKADIRALIKKSKQLQETVRMLDPDREQTAEDAD